MSNNLDLDESILIMTREELLEEVADRIQCVRELMSLHRKEEGILRQENQMLKEALTRGMTTMNHTMDKLKEFEMVIDRGTKAILMWRRSCYLLTGILIFMASILVVK